MLNGVRDAVVRLAVGPAGVLAGKKKLLGVFAALLLAAPGCASSNANTKATEVRPGIVAIPHAAFDPSMADAIARGADYGAWVELRNEHTLDLAVWLSTSAATKAVDEYRRGGRRTQPDASLGTAWPRRVRKIEQIRNVTIAWYHLPTFADEQAIRGALRFGRGKKSPGNYTALWVIPGTAIDADATAATQPARYSARLEGAGIPGNCAVHALCRSVRGPVTLAIWQSAKAANAYINGYKDLPLAPPVTQIRNVTIEAADFSTAKVSKGDEMAIKKALH